MVNLGITINVARQTTPLPTGNFSLPLVLGMSGNTPQDQYDVFETQADLENTYDPADHPHIVDHGQAIFDNGASRVAVLNVARSSPSSGQLSTALDTIVGEIGAVIMIEPRPRDTFRVELVEGVALHFRAARALNHNAIRSGVLNPQGPLASVEVIGPVCEVENNPVVDRAQDFDV